VRYNGPARLRQDGGTPACVAPDPATSNDLEAAMRRPIHVPSSTSRIAPALPPTVAQPDVPLALTSGSGLWSVERHSGADRVTVRIRPDDGPFLDVWSLVTAGARTVMVSGEVDCLTAPDFQQLLFDVLSRPDAPCIVVIDLRGVTFLGAAGLTVLILVHRMADSAGQVLSIRCGTARAIIRPLQITGLWDVLPIVEKGPSRDGC
jgi:anti-sigma B factor antagonist